MQPSWPVWVTVIGFLTQAVAQKRQIELAPFKQLAHGLRSGPIFVMNNNTFFITNLHYDGRGPDAHFWAGKGKSGPNEYGILVPDEKNSNESVSGYSGQDIYITLPNKMTIHDIDYIGMWCIQFKHNFGYTNIPRNISEAAFVKNPKYDTKGIPIIRYPKCCPVGELKTPDGCKKNDESTPAISVYDGNLTVYNDEPMTNITLVPYVYQPDCQFKMFTLDPETDQFYYLKIGMILLDAGEFITKDRFCLDNHEVTDEENNPLGIKQAVFMCFMEDHVPDFLNTFLAACIYMSALFLIITSIIFIFIKAARDMRGINGVGYTIFMALSFICLATARILHVTGTACIVFGFIYQFLLVSSFTWLFCLTFETYYKVTHYDKPHDRRRYYIYTGCALGLPVLAVIISLFINKSIPQQFSRPTLGYEPCWFRSDKKVIFYYVPIGISIALNIIFAVLTWRKIKYADAHGNDNWTMIDNKGLKNVFRSCYLLLIIMSICWAAEILSHFLQTKNGFWIAIDIIDSLQGLFVFLIFIMHNPVINILRRTFPKVFKTTNNTNVSELRSIYRSQMDTPVHHIEELAKIKRNDSTENLNDC